MMNILIMGAAGSGKGTVSQYIADYFKIPHISTGDMFREAIALGTDLGKLAKQYMDQGKLVPDEITISMAKERILKDDCQKGFILDGFPRTLAQAQAFEKIAKENNREIEYVIDLDISIDDLAPRIVNRRLCKKCGAIYNLVSLPPKKENICDNCGSELVHRADDTLESLKTRMTEYYNLTEPVLKYFEEKGLVKKINAGQDREKVWLDIKSVLEK